MTMPPIASFFELSRRRQIIVVITFAILWFLLARIGRLFLNANLLCTWYPNAGLSLGFAVYFGPIFVLFEAIVRAIHTAYFLNVDFSMKTILAYNFAPAVLTLLLSYPLRRIISWKGRVQSPQVAAVFLICIVVLGFIKAALVMILNSLTGMMKFSDFLGNLISWWTGDLIGMMTVAPAMVAVVGPLLMGHLQLTKDIKLYLRAAAFVVAIFLIFEFFYYNYPDDHYRYWHLMIPVHVIAAVVIGFRWLTIQLFIVNMALTLLEYYHPSEALPYEQQMFLTVLSGVGLYLALLFDEKKVHEEKLQRQSAPVSQSDEAEALFANILSHELRTPLSAVIGYAEIMMNEKSNASNEVGLIKIRANTEKLINLVERLSSFVNPQQLFNSVKLEKIDLHKIVLMVFEKHESQAVLKKNKLIYRGSHKIEFFSNPDVVYGILDELISNALKFTSDGVVSIDAQVIKELVHITVTDNGIGMAEGFQPFATFEQESKGLTREFPGLGIGLSTCRMWAESIGGKLTLNYSEKGKGTQFQLILNHRKTQ